VTAAAQQPQGPAMDENLMQDTSLVKVDLCCGPKKPPGFIGVDICQCPGVDIVHDLTQSFPFDDNHIDYLRAHDALEHLPDRIRTMNEIFRVCKNGAIVDVMVPSTDGRGAFQDPTHVSYWNINSFVYYSSQYQAWDLCRQYGFKGDFKIENLQNIQTGQNVIHVVAVLRVVKPGAPESPLAHKIIAVR
jgi:hypothetical protein